MDPRLLRAYNEELTYLRESARSFGEEHEDVAGRLGLKNPTDPDPYIERLLEGVAFLGARVKLKLQDQFPDFTQHLLQAVQPHYLASTPSMCVVAFDPKDGDAVKGPVVPRLTELTSPPVESGGSAVTFRTGHAVPLWPVRIAEAEYLPSRAAIGQFAAAAGVRAEAGLRLRFAGLGNAPVSACKADTLDIFIAGSETIPGELYRQILGETLAVAARPTTAGPGEWLRLPTPEPVGFDDDQALLPAERRSFRGYRLLSEYFACPERFMFFRLSGLKKLFETSGDAAEVILLFGRNAPSLPGAVSAANFRLFATPAVNLFEKQLGRTATPPFQHEHQLIPDRTRPLDFEVWRVLDVTAYGRSNADPRPAAPLYAFGALLYDFREALFYVTRLTARRLSTKEQRARRRTDYVGTETWISLTSPGDPDRLSGVHELAIRALVTNRELPELLRFSGRGSDLATQGIPVKATTVVRAPTRPRPPLGLADSAWRVISHLTPNYATMAFEDGDDPSILRDHLALYGRTDDPLMRRQIDGVLSLSAETVTRRVPDAGRLAFARGLRLKFKLDDAAFENARMYLFASVLDRFMAEFAAVNSFTESVFESANEGVFTRCPPRLGRRRNI